MQKTSDFSMQHAAQQADLSPAARELLDSLPSRLADQGRDASDRNVGHHLAALQHDASTSSAWRAERPALAAACQELRLAMGYRH